MGDFTQVTLEEINGILSHYDLGKASYFVATTSGISNSNYKVTLQNKENILLKISNDKDYKQLLAEQNILHLLKEHRFPYSLEPFKGRNNKLVYQHANYNGVIFPWVDAEPPRDVTKIHTFQIGKSLATLHSLKICDSELKKIRSYELVGFGGKKLRNYIHQKKHLEDFEKTFKAIFPDELSRIPINEFEQGIIHGDLYADNSLFKNNDLVTLVDFEQAGVGRYILDIGISISGSCLTNRKDNIDHQLLQSFLQGYESVRPLPPLEKPHLNDAILVGFFSISLWRIKRFFDGNLDPSRKYNYRELLNLAINFHNSLLLN